MSLEFLYLWNLKNSLQEIKTLCNLKEEVCPAWWEERIWHSKSISKQMIKITNLQCNQNLFPATNSMFENVQWSSLNSHCALTSSVCHHPKQNERNLYAIAGVPCGGSFHFTSEEGHLWGSGKPTKHLKNQKL